MIAPKEDPVLRDWKAWRQGCKPPVAVDVEDDGCRGSSAAGWCVVLATLVLVVAVLWAVLS